MLRYLYNADQLPFCHPSVGENGTATWMACMELHPSYSFKGERDGNYIGPGKKRTKCCLALKQQNRILHMHRNLMQSELQCEQQGFSKEISENFQVIEQVAVRYMKFLGRFLGIPTKLLHMASFLWSRSRPQKNNLCSSTPNYINPSSRTSGENGKPQA